MAHNGSSKCLHQQQLVATINNDIVREDIHKIIVLICKVLLGQILCVCGIAANIINMAVFVKQGLRDSATICLFALALADLLSVATMLVHDICHIPLLRYSDTPYETVHLQYMVAGWPHIACSRLIAWLTAFISFERCICISLPLKVKSLITPKRITITAILLFVVTATCITPVYWTTSLGWRFFPNRNKTLIGLVFINEENRNLIEKIAFVINSVFFPMTSFLCVVIFSSVLIVRLHQKTKWRIIASSSNLRNVQMQNSKLHTENAFQKRDEKIAKMIFLISVVFILCFLPSFIMFSAIISDSRFNFDTGIYTIVTEILFACSCVTEPFNSSIGTVIYYQLSSKYRHTFNDLFKRRIKT